MKIGEALVKAGLITEDQLALALERQVVFNGRIDTNIVELRFLDDEKLTRFLGQFLKLPIITSDLINSIPDDIIKTLKKEVVEKYGILPFKKEGARLHVAMLNPKNLKDIEDLRFITSFDIIPYVITELKLLNALEKYYGIKKELRYSSMKDRFDPLTETESVIIERSEGRSTQADTGKATEEISADKIRSASQVEKETGKTTDLVGALLSNAFFTAKLFYAVKRLPHMDNEIEDEVLRNWAHFQKSVELLRRQSNKT